VTRTPDFENFALAAHLLEIWGLTPAERARILFREAPGGGRLATSAGRQVPRIAVLLTQAGLSAEGIAAWLRRPLKCGLTPLELLMSSRWSAAFRAARSEALPRYDLQALFPFLSEMKARGPRLKTANCSS